MKTLSSLQYVKQMRSLLVTNYYFYKVAKFSVVVLFRNVLLHACQLFFYKCFSHMTTTYPCLQTDTYIFRTEDHPGRLAEGERQRHYERRQSVSGIRPLHAVSVVHSSVGRRGSDVNRRYWPRGKSC